ncbi:MAG: hypothetical protein WBO29_11335 [Albidovulum sp.]
MTRTLPTLTQLLRGLALSAFFAVTPALATATSTPVELGSDGTIYRLWSGTFGELFGPGNTSVPADFPVLALDTVAPGQPLVRQLVPGTGGSATEGSAALLFDPSSSSVHIVWNSRNVANLTVSRLHLRTLTPTGWSNLIELSSGSLTDKSGLRLALTADDYAATVDGVAARLPRRVLHLVWAETAGDATRAFYSPVVFDNGTYVGWNPVVALDELSSPDPSQEAPGPLSLALRAQPTLVAAPTGKVTVSFVHSQSLQLVTVSVQALPGELGELAEMARGHIVALAATYGVEDRAQLAAFARGHIVALAESFHPSAATYIGDHTSELLISADPSADGATLAEMARGHIVALGREILAGGLANPCAGEEVQLEVPPLDPSTAAADTAFSHFLTMHRVASWDVPSDLVSPEARILPSSDGSRATIAWPEEGHLFYREAEANGEWSPLRDIDLSQIPLAEAWDAVARRASGL